MPSSRRCHQGRISARPFIVGRDDFRESPVRFDCEGEQLIGVIAEPIQGCELGVVIIVGGPQYRVGSHRQFVLLARELARHGFAALRFDYRGMGDSTGSQRSFEAISADIRAAIDALLENCPRLRRVALWGLCDGASAAMMYAVEDRRVAGLVLANPWARGSETLARTHLRHYYLQRLRSADFWTKVLRGRFNMRHAASELGAVVSDATTGAVRKGDYRTLMTDRLSRFNGAVLLLLSGLDLTAQEFLMYMNSSKATRSLLDRVGSTRIDLPEADHTFSASPVRGRVEQATVSWLRALDIPGRPS